MPFYKNILLQAFYKRSKNFPSSNGGSQVTDFYFAGRLGDIYDTTFLPSFLYKNNRTTNEGIICPSTDVTYDSQTAMAEVHYNLPLDHTKCNGILPEGDRGLKGARIFVLK